MEKQAVKVMCAFCGEFAVKNDLQPSPIGGAKCKDWFECARRREVALRSQVRVQ